MVKAVDFVPVLKLALPKLPYKSVGLAFVPQEGETAGRVDFQVVTDCEDTRDEDTKLEIELSDLLFHRTESSMESLEASFVDIDFIPLEGQFGTPIGYLWGEISNGNAEDDTLHFLKNYILDTVERSKKATFHNVFSKNLENLDQTKLFQNIADSIKKGLYSDTVVVWIKERGLLTSTNIPGIDLTLSRSLAGKCFKEGHLVYDDFSEVPDKQIQNIHFIKDNEIGSGFFFKIGGDTGEEDNGGVVGVFFHRPYGTTHIDKQLCSYAITYYDIVWRQKFKIETLANANSTYDEIAPFYKDAVSSLVEFHDLTAIHMGLTSAISETRVTAYNRKDVLADLDVVSRRLSDLRKLIQANSNALTVAPRFSELLTIGEESEIQFVDIGVLLDDEIGKIERAVLDHRGRVETHYDLNFSNALICKNDYVKVLSNLLTNASRSLKQRTRGGGVIRVSLIEEKQGYVTIVVEDNGPGVKQENLNHIFDMHFTTHTSDGGRGIGLAVVRSVARKHGGLARVKSEWGRGAAFRVDLNYKLK